MYKNNVNKAIGAVSHVPPHGRWLKVRTDAARGVAGEENATREIL
jgi:hypothetical protein